MTNALLLIGIATTLVFLVVVIVEGTLRPNYQPAYHMVSALSLGDRGWVQVTNFLQMGIGTLALAVAINQTLDTVVGPVLIAVFGAGAIASGLFNMDPSFGYPPGAPAEMPTLPTRQHQLHGAAGASCSSRSSWHAWPQQAVSMAGGASTRWRPPGSASP